MPPSAVALALLLAACGGISERHDDAGGTSDADASTPAQHASVSPAPQKDTPAADEEALCEAVCGVCMAGALGESCPKFCGETIAGAASAACSAAFTSVLRCRTKAPNACALDACPTEDNAFSVCVFDYCASNGMSDVCLAPL